MNIHIFHDEVLIDTLRIVVADRWSWDDALEARSRFIDLQNRLGRPVARIMDLQSLLLPRELGFVQRVRELFYSSAHDPTTEIVVCVLPLSSPVARLIEVLERRFSHGGVPVHLTATLDEARQIIRRHRASEPILTR